MHLMFVMPRLAFIALLVVAAPGCTESSTSERATPGPGASRGAAAPPEAEADDGGTPNDGLDASALEDTEPPPTVATAATLEVVAALDRQLDARLAFGADGRWWHWDGMEATAFVDGARQEEALDAASLLAAEPVVPPGHALMVGESLLTPSGARPLHGEIAGVFEPHPMAHGGYERIASAWSADASVLAIARRYRPSACCGREHDHGRGPPRDVVDLYDTRTGEHHELHGRPPVAVSSSRLLAGDALHVLDPLHPLHVPVAGMGASRTAVMDPSGEMIARARIDGELRLARASDGATVRTWSGPEGAAALAFHPRVPVLAVASTERLELWRIDLAEPERLAQVPLAQAPHALVFDPMGSRLVATGFRPVLLRLTLEERPRGPEPTPLQRALEAHPDASTAWMVPGDVEALVLDEDRVHAYAGHRALHSLELDSGLRSDSWVRRHPGYGVASAARAPIFALVEDEHDREPTAATQRVELFDAARYVSTHTRWIPVGELDPLVVSPQGTAIAWSLEDDPIATLRTADGSTRLDMHAGSVDVVAIAISEDDTRMAIANRHVKRNVKVGTVGRTEVVELTTPRGVTHLLFSPDGTRLLVADFDGRVHVTDPTTDTGTGTGTGSVLRTLDPGLGAVEAMAITADGTRLVVGHGGVVLTLDVTSGAELGRLTIPARLHSLAVSNDGSVIVAGTTEGHVRRSSGP